MTDRHPIGRLYDVADDFEMATLDALRERAGMTWECRDEDGRSHWTNDETETVCSECGTPRGQARAVKS